MVTLSLYFLCPAVLIFNPSGSADILKVEYLNLAAAQAGREEFDHLECMTVEVPCPRAKGRLYTA